jgi:hypothetical protein
MSTRDALAAALAVVALAAGARGADRIILRNTKVVADRVVEGFDPDGIRLSGSPPMALTWDEVEAAKIARGQAEFDAMLKQLGDPLYRIRLRLGTGDYRDLLDQAEAVFPTYRARRSQTAYMVFCALMWGRLADGRRADALEPYLLALECLRAAPQGRLALPGARRPRFDARTGLSDELLPVWFDADAAREALPGVLKAIESARAPAPAGVYLQAATLALAAGEPEEAGRLASLARSDAKAVSDLAAVVAAQRELAGATPAAGPAVAALRGLAASREFTQEPLARYWLGVADLASPDERTRKRGVVELLHLPALWGDAQPELAAQALDRAQRAVDAMGDPGASALRSELLFHYPATVAAARLRAELGEGKAEAPPGPAPSARTK